MTGLITFFFKSDSPFSTDVTSGSKLELLVGGSTVGKVSKLCAGDA